jgi:hypothetical protein
MPDKASASGSAPAPMPAAQPPIGNCRLVDFTLILAEGLPAGGPQPGPGGPRSSGEHT